MGAKIHDKLILLWLLTFLSVGWSDIFDWRDHMEDAFADEGHTDETCKKNLNDKFIFCRYQAEDNKSLSRWEPCLCTHILITAEPNMRRFNIPHSLKSTDREKKVIASISVSGDDKLNASSDFQQLLSALSDLSINGIDMRVEQSAKAADASKSKIFQYIQDIVSLLRTEAKFQILSITVQRNMAPFLHDPQFLEIASYFDFLSFLPPLSLRISEGNTEEYFDALQELASLLKSGFPKSKLLMPISLRQQMRNVMKETFIHDIYPTMCQYIDTEQNKSMELPSTKYLNLVDELRNEVRYILDKDVAGVDIWFINDDDEQNICGKGHFSLIKEISNSIKNGKDSFDSFTDLDITLSTGESQITEKIQVLHEQNTDPEEMRKFKCEKIGFYRHPTDCSKFYHCADYRATTAQPESQHAVFVYKCPRGLVYDELQGSCNWPSYSEPCQGSAELMPVPLKKFKCTTPGFHIHPVDCRWFYYCSDLGDGQLAAFEFLCPSHLLGFDERNMLCNWKWMVPQCKSTEQESVKPITEQSHYAREGHPGVRIRDKITSILNANKVVTDTVLPVAVGNPIAEARNIPSDVRVQSHTQEDFFRRDQLSITKVAPRSDTSLTSKSVERKTASFVNYTDAISLSPEKAEYKPEKSVIEGSNTSNSTEKKYGTAYWHRSMITNPSRVQIPPNVFDVKIENIGDPSDVSEDKSISKIPEENNSSKEHRYGIGGVRKLNVRPVRNQSVNEQLHGINFKKEEPYISNQDVISLKDSNDFSRNEKTSRNYHSNGQSYYAENLQGRAIGKNVLTNYKFEDLINRHQNPKNNYQSEVVRNQQRNLANTNNFGDESNSQKNPQNTNSYARVKCSKLTLAATNNDPKTIDDNTFGCTGEVSLFVKMKEGNEFSKYVLKAGDISNSAHQESQQHKLLVNETGVKNNFKSQNLQLGDTDEPVPKIQNRNEGEVKSENVYSQGRSVSRDLNLAISARSAPLMLQAIRLDDQEKDEKDNVSLKNPVLENQNSEKENSLEENNFHYSLRHEKEKETLTINTKAKFMALSFYPQGVLLNVDLNHINEIPPQILLEVDIMLKNFMTNGKIDVNLLMKRLNATMEPMENVEHSDNITNDKIDSMLNMLENILNSTDSKNSGTESYKNISGIPLTSDISVNSTTEELPYENITSLIGMTNNKTEIDVSKPDVNKTNNSISSTQRKNEKNTQTEEVRPPADENKPFVRRRLFRKYRYPSIREQLELQELLASHRTTTQTPQPSTSTKKPKVISNRIRYPSIREQLLWSNNIASGDSRNSLVSEKENPSTPVIEFDDEKGYSSYSDKEEFGKRITTAEKDNNFQTNTGWSSSSLGNKLVNRNLATNMSKNSIYPHSSQDASFHLHHSNVNFVPYTSSENVRNTNYPQNYEGYSSPRPPSDTSRFQYTLPLSPESYPKENPSYPSQSLPVVNYFNIHNYFNVQNNGPLQNSTENSPPLVPQDLSTGDRHSFNHHDQGSVRYRPENLPIVPQGDLHSFDRQNTGYVRYKIENPLTVSQDLPTGKVHSLDNLNRGSVRYKPENPSIPHREPHKIESPTIVSQNLHHNRGSVRYMSESPSIPHSITSNKENPNVLHNRGIVERDPVFSQSTPFDSSRHHNHGSVPFSPENPSILTQSMSNGETNPFNQNNPGSSYLTAEYPSILSHDVPISAKTSFNDHRNGYSSDGNSDLRNINLNNQPQKRRRKSKKLRILVKKVPNGEGNNEDFASRRDEQDNKHTRIPKKLLTEIRTNLIRKLAINGKSDVELEIQFQDHVWNIPFVNNKNSVDISHVICTRAGLFQHPKDCNMFYECFWDKWLKRFTLHAFSCPVRLVYDDSIRGCSRPTTESNCRNSI